jgi:hypothetical protein
MIIDRVLRVANTAPQNSQNEGLWNEGMKISLPAPRPCPLCPRKRTN